MKSKLLIGVAALALIAGSGIASAQSGAQQDMKSGQQTAPSAQKPESAPSQAQSGSESRQENGARQGQSQPSGERPGSAATQDSEKKAQQGTQQQRQGQQDRNGANQRQTQDRDGDKKRDGQAQTESKPGGGKDAKAELNSDQRTKISQTIKTQNVKRVTNVNFNISVGTVVPRSYSFYPVPATVIAVVPAWRGYLYIVVGDQMLILHPRTHEIVAIIAV